MNESAPGGVAPTTETPCPACRHPLPNPCPMCHDTFSRRAAEALLNVDALVRRVADFSVRFPDHKATAKAKADLRVALRNLFGEKELATLAAACG